MKVKDLQNLIKNANPEATVRLYGHGGPGAELDFFSSVGNIKQCSSLIFIQGASDDYFFEND